MAPSPTSTPSWTGVSQWGLSFMSSLSWWPWSSSTSFCFTSSTPSSGVIGDWLSFARGNGLEETSQKIRMEQWQLLMTVTKWQCLWHANSQSRRLKLRLCDQDSLQTETARRGIPALIGKKPISLFSLNWSKSLVFKVFICKKNSTLITQDLEYPETSHSGSFERSVFNLVRHL